MQGQRSILSYLRKKPSPESVDADDKRFPQFPANSAPDVTGTDTPPEKTPRKIIPASSDTTKPCLFSSIMHKFAKIDQIGVSPERKQLESGSTSSSSYSLQAPGVNMESPELETPPQSSYKLKVSRFSNRLEGFSSQIEIDTDELGPETPAMQPLVPRIKRIHEDCIDLTDKSNCSILSSSKRLKLAETSETTKCQETSDGNSSKFEWLNPSSIRDGNKRRPGDPLYDRKTLYIPPDVLKKMSASQKQYWSIKCQYMDIVLFFKVGKFYELYELDAEIGNKELDWKMTFSGVGKCRQVGISESGIEYAIQKLIARGYKVGRIEQLETSDQAKSRGSTSVIQRKLVNVVTPSTLTDGYIGPDAVHLLAIKEGSSKLENGSTIYGFAFVDCAALRFWVGSISDDASCAALGALLMQVSPKEVIYESKGLSREAQKAIQKYSSAGPTMLTSMLSVTDYLDASGVKELIESNKYFKGSFNTLDIATNGGTHNELAVCALGGIVNHLSRMMLNDILCNGDVLPYLVYRGCLRLDGQSLVNLEIFGNNVDGGTEGTLYKYLDNCLTSSGKRLLRSWICHPLKDVGEISDRLDVVEGLINNPETSYLIAQYLRKIPDVERLLGRVKASVGSSAALLLPLLGEKLLKQRVKTYGTLVKGLRVGVDLLLLLQSKEHETLSLSKMLDFPLQGGSDGLDELISQFEATVDSDFPNYQDQALSSSDGETLSVLVELFVENASRWSQVIHALNCIDVLRSFAVTASSSLQPMCRPVFTAAESRSTMSRQETGGPVLKLKGLWHPYASIGTNSDKIVPNDVYLGGDPTGSGHPTLLLTGPNMGGKSTLLRATCLAVILAQLGCYVPCETCVLSPVDIIFTRLGATDRIMSGESTFLIECTETASVLQNATRDSLVILDELGRGTSTFDGYAIAYAVFRHLVEKVKCRLLFATHYHSLTKEFASHPSVTLQHMACSFTPKPEKTFSDDKELVFLYKLANGACPESYGLQVALMAGIPPKVVQVAAKASVRMKGLIGKNFKSSEQRSEFSSLHEEWVKNLLGFTKYGGNSLEEDEDACDMFHCLFHELKSFYRSRKCSK
ncbi:DNA mismatch repair protein msh7 [Ranunculus cassubicifolius]